MSISGTLASLISSNQKSLKNKYATVQNDNNSTFNNANSSSSNQKKSSNKYEGRKTYVRKKMAKNQPRLNSKNSDLLLVSYLLSLLVYFVVVTISLITFIEIDSSNIYANVFP